MQTYKIRDMSNAEDESKTFELIESVKSLIMKNRGSTIQARWRNNLAGGEAFARRTLEIAAIQSTEALHEFKGDIILDWKRTSDLAAKAKNSIELAAKHLAVGSQKWSLKTVEEKDLAIKKLAEVIRHMKAQHKLKKPTTVNRSQNSIEACRDAEAILGAIVLFDWIREFANEKRKIVAGSYKNPGAPQKRAFAKVMMESWIWFTGKQPGVNNNQFCHFLDVGWSDICVDTNAAQKTTNWSQSIIEARKSFNVHEIAYISDVGPSWK